MAPFPETEILTIKRLEVALRKMDMRLLKDGAYKLHEKYHSGFKFEYLDLLKDIFSEVRNNNSIPNEIKEILNSTIEDILNSQGVEIDNVSSPYEVLDKQHISPLTSLSYKNENQEEYKNEAFEVFGTNKNNTPNTTQNQYTQSSITEKPFNEFNNNTSTIENNSDITTDIQDTTKTEVKKENKSIAIFYGQESSNEKIKNITNYRELISKIDEEHKSINEILGLLSEINTQSNVNISELQGLLDKIKTKENKINLITNSQSCHLIELMKNNNITYSLFNSSGDKNINLLPILGLTNLFKCCECNAEYLDTNDEITPLVLQCPHCKGAMFANFYTTNEKNTELNMDYYNKSIIALANSKIWLLIHPVLTDKIMFDLLKSALSISKNVEEIYILDKEINTRETCNKIFNEINPNINVNIKIVSFEEFFDLID